MLMACRYTWWGGVIVKYDGKVVEGFLGTLKSHFMDECWWLALLSPYCSQLAGGDTPSSLKTVHILLGDLYKHEQSQASLNNIVLCTFSPLGEKME